MEGEEGRAEKRRREGKGREERERKGREVLLQQSPQEGL